MGFSIEEKLKPLVEYLYYHGISRDGMKRILMSEPIVFCLDLETAIVWKVCHCWLCWDVLGPRSECFLFLLRFYKLNEFFCLNFLLLILVSVKFSALFSISHNDSWITCMLNSLNMNQKYVKLCHFWCCVLFWQFLIHFSFMWRYGFFRTLTF